MELLGFIFDNSIDTAALLVGVVFFVGAVILGLTVVEERQKSERKRAYWKGRNSGKVTRFRKTSSDPADFAAEQLKVVASAKFASRPLLNKSEAAVFKALDQAVIARNPNWQVMAQVSLGEFLSSPSKDAYFAVNSKRVDFALMDENSCVVHVLEYQGTGHHTGSSAAARDAVKKEALRKAGIGYHEIVAGHTTPSELRALVEKLVPAG